MNIPKPTPPKPKPPVEASPEVTTPIQPVKKAPFVPQPHLTQNPFKENEALQDLQKSMKKPTAPRRKPAPKKEK